MKKTHEEENRERYGLEGNTARLSFEKGEMVSRSSLNDVTIRIDLRYCKGCGICTEECPTGALRLEKEQGALGDTIRASFPEMSPEGRDFHPDRPLAWQELPHHGGLVVVGGQDSYNLTGSWRIGEVVIGDADKCVVCGLCYQHCPEDIICVVSGESGDSDGDS
jgi:Pyruvate/2-oxoacid:ferredoxin oxidoreductase delta subunit